MDPTANPEPPESGGQVASVGEKRPAETEGSDERPAKRARGRTEEEMQRVAEIVLVLSAMAGMRGGGKNPTEAEMELMAEARAKLVEICEGFAPKDLVDRDAIWTVVEDLGLNWKAKDQRLGFRGSRLSIKEKFSLAKRKMDDLKKFPAPATAFTQSLGPMHTIRTIASDKPSTAALASGGVIGSSAPQGHNPLAATPAAATYKPQATVSSGLASAHLARDSSATAFPGVDKTQPKVVGGTNGTTSYAPQVQGRVAPENKMLNYNAAKVDGTSELGSVLRPSSQATRDQAFRPVVTQSPSTSLPSMQNSTSLPGIHQSTQQNVKFVHPSSFLNNHGEIAKIVQKLLQPKLPGHPTWTPPSRDYMSKAFACQICRLNVNEVETVVLCDSCEKGYHLKCLEAVNQKGIPRGEWHCSKCTALSAGKPLPPKYGRVMRSMTTPLKGPSNIAGAQSSSDKKIETADPKVSQENIMDKSSSLKNAAGSDSVACNNPDSCLDLKTPKEKETAGSVSSGGKVVEQEIIARNLSSNFFERPTQQSEVSESCKLEEGSTFIFHCPAALSDKVEKNVDLKPSYDKQDVVQSEAPISDNVSSKVFQENSIVKESEILRRNNDYEPSLDTKKSEQEVVHAYSLGKSEDNDGGRGHTGVTSDGLRNVEWIGNVLTVVDGKRYYESCCVDGSTYKLQDHAFFHSSHAKLIPSKLQAMWEDIKSGSKWVLVNRCYFPDDLPKAVGHPCAPESNEVYESNHGISVMAGLIQGPCEVLPPTKFREKIERQSQSGIEANDGSPPVFLCKWFYDESKGNFQPVFS